LLAAKSGEAGVSSRNGNLRTESYDRKVSSLDPLPPHAKWPAHVAPAVAPADRARASLGGRPSARARVRLRPTPELVTRFRFT